jgi:hypothetical protein
MAKKLARPVRLLTPTGVISWRSIRGSVALLAGLGSVLPGQVPDVALTRPGQIVITAVTGEVSVTMNGQRRPAKVDERVRVDAVVASGRRSMATLAFSNGAVLELSSESEIEVEEVLQAPFSGNAKPELMKEEPSVSRTKVRLIRGEVRLAVKPLKVARGSAFIVTMPAGSARLEAGSFYAMVRMTDVGIGMCAVELERGAAEFEPVGATWAKLPPGSRLAFAVEIDRASGGVKIGPMPAAEPAKK